MEAWGFLRPLGSFLLNWLKFNCQSLRNISQQVGVVRTVQAQSSWGGKSKHMGLRTLSLYLFFSGKPFKSVLRFSLMGTYKFGTGNPVFIYRDSFSSNEKLKANPLLQFWKYADSFFSQPLLSSPNFQRLSPFRLNP